MKGVLFMFFVNAVFTESAKPRSVNVALKTVLEFDNKDNSGDIRFIDKIQNFLNRIKTAITKNQANVESRRKNDESEMKFTDFIEKVAMLLKSYEDDDLQDVFVYLLDELEQRRAKSRNYEIISGSMRRFITYKLREIGNTTSDNIRKILDSLLFSVRNKFPPQSQKKLIKFINSIYTKETMKKFEKNLHNLQIYKSKSKRTNLELNKIIKDAVRFVFFDHYANLSEDSRRYLKIKIESFWKDWIRSNSKHYRVSSGKSIAYNDASINLRIYSETKSLRSRKTTKKFETKLTTPDRDVSDTKSVVENEAFNNKDGTNSHKITKIKSKREKPRKKHSKHKITTKKFRIQTLWQESINKEDHHKHFIQKSSNFATRKNHKKYRQFTTKQYIKHTKNGASNKSVQSSESRSAEQDRKDKTQKHRSEQSSKYPIPRQSRKSFLAHSSIEEGLSIESFEIDSKSATEPYRRELNVINSDIEKLYDTFTSANAEQQPGFDKYKKQSVSEKKGSLKEKIKNTKEISVENEKDELDYEPLKFRQETIGPHKKVNGKQMSLATTTPHGNLRYNNISSIENIYAKNSTTQFLKTNNNNILHNNGKGLDWLREKKEDNFNDSKEILDYHENSESEIDAENKIKHSSIGTVDQIKKKTNKAPILRSNDNIQLMQITSPFYINNHHNEIKQVNDKVGNLLKSLMAEHDERKPIDFTIEGKTDNVIESDANNFENLKSLFSEKKTDINFGQYPENMEVFTTKLQDFSETYLEKPKQNELNSEKMIINILDGRRRIENVSSKENSVNYQLYARNEDKSLHMDRKDVDYKAEKETEVDKTSTKEITETSTVSHEIFISNLNNFLNSSNYANNTHKTLKRITESYVKNRDNSAKTTMINIDSTSKTEEEKNHLNKTIKNTIKTEDKDKHPKVESLTRNKRENATIKRRKKKTRRNNDLNKKKLMIIKDFTDTEDLKREESIKSLENQLKNIIDIQEDGEELMKTKSVVTPSTSTQNPVIFLRKFFSRTDSPHITNRDKIQRAHRRILEEIQNILDPTRPTSPTTPIALFDDELKDLDDAIELL